MSELSATRYSTRRKLLGTFEKKKKSDKSDELRQGSVHPLFKRNLIGTDQSTVLLRVKGYYLESSILLYFTILPFWRGHSEKICSKKFASTAIKRKRKLLTRPLPIGKVFELDRILFYFLLFGIFTTCLSYITVEYTEWNNRRPGIEWLSSQLANWIINQNASAKQSLLVLLRVKEWRKKHAIWRLSSLFRLVLPLRTRICYYHEDDLSGYRAKKFKITVPAKKKRNDTSSVDNNDELDNRFVIRNVINQFNQKLTSTLLLFYFSFFVASFLFSPILFMAHLCRCIKSCLCRFVRHTGIF